MITMRAKPWKSIYLVLIVLVSWLSVSSQFKVQIRLIDIPASHPADSIFAAGNFNNWAPGRPEFLFVKNGRNALLEMEGLDSGSYQFKFTRGSWDKVECKPGGLDIDNHSLLLTSDTVLQYIIPAWKDDFAPVAKTHTVSKNVTILDTAFPMPQLNRTRRIWIYLPPGYAAGKKRYPVMYMNDGQNIFDEYTAAFGEW